MKTLETIIAERKATIRSMDDSNREQVRATIMASYRRAGIVDAKGRLIPQLQR